MTRGVSRSLEVLSSNSLHRLLKSESRKATDRRVRKFLDVRLIFRTDPRRQTPLLLRGGQRSKKGSVGQDRPVRLLSGGHKGPPSVENAGWGDGRKDYGSAPATKQKGDPGKTRCQEVLQIGKEGN